MIGSLLILMLAGAGEPGTPRNADPGIAYVGDAACAPCHRREAESYPGTAMGRSAGTPSHPAEKGLLALPPEGISFLHPPSGNKYRVWFDGETLKHSETRLGPGREETFTDVRSIDFTLGSGDRGQTFLLRTGDRLYQSPVAFRPHREGWGMAAGYDTPRHPRFTRPVAGPCLFCHANRSTFVEGTLNEYRDPPFEGLAIGCERCHGPGALHVQERRSLAPTETGVDTSIVNPRRLSPERRDDVCFQCHLQGSVRLVRAGHDLYDFRPGLRLGDYFAVYHPRIGSGDPGQEGIEVISHVERLRASRCWSASGGAITCLTCHDPHRTPRGEEASRQFAAACLTCHDLGDCDLRTMKDKSQRRDVDPGDCVACHMAKAPPSDAPHTLFTDHLIARVPSPVPPAGEAHPEEPVELVSFFEPGADARRNLGAAHLLMALRSGDFRHADIGASILEPLLPTLDDDFNALRMLAEHYRRTDDEKRAVATLERLAALAPQMAEIRIELARAYERDGRSDEALALATRAVKEDPLYAPARETLGALLMDRGRIEAAREHLLEAVRIDPAAGPSHLRLGEIAAGGGDADRAVASYETALALLPGSRAARIGLARLRLERGEGQSALDLLNEALALSPDAGSRASVRYRLAGALVSLGRTGEAATQLEILLQEDPSHAGARDLLDRLKNR